MITKEVEEATGAGVSTKAMTKIEGEAKRCTEFGPSKGNCVHKYYA